MATKRNKFRPRAIEVTMGHNWDRDLVAAAKRCEYVVDGIDRDQPCDVTVTLIARHPASVVEDKLREALGFAGWMDVRDAR